MPNIRRVRVGFSVVATGREYGLSCGVGQHVDLDTVPEDIRAQIPDEFFDPAEDAPTPRRRRASGDEVKHGD
jgi:hypothetical protein